MTRRDLCMKKVAIKYLWAILITCMLSACGGGSNDQAATTRNAHEPGWRFTHDDPALLAQARNDLTDCQVCHRADLLGGSGVPGCLACHLDGPPFNLHPLSAYEDLRFPWASLVNHGRAARRDIASCQGCHGMPGGPGSNPRFDVSLRDLRNGCESLDCHGAKTNLYADLISNQRFIDEVAHPPHAAHPASGAPDNFHWFGRRIEAEHVISDPVTQTLRKVVFVGHWDADNLQVCTLCHGSSGQGGSGPSCLICHVTSPLVQPQGCVSCHGGPPVGPVENYMVRSARTQPLDAAFLALVDEGYHFKHAIVPKQDSDCRVCHEPRDSGVTPDPNDPNRVVNRHHFEIIDGIIPVDTVAPYPPNQPGEAYSCFSCHVMTVVDGLVTVEPQKDCIFCHGNLLED